MGGTTFIKKCKGATAREAFNTAVREAQYMSGHGGYTGTIAEKSEWRMATAKSMTFGEACVYAEAEFDNPQSPFDDKWGPAGCIALGGDEWVFFGWASC